MSDSVSLAAALTAWLPTLAGVGFLMAVAWFVLASRARRADAEAQADRAELATRIGGLQQELTLGNERLAVRAVRLAELEEERNALRLQLDSVRDTLTESAAQAAAGAAAVERLEAQAVQLRHELALVAESRDAASQAHADLQADHRALMADRDEKLASARREVEALKALREDLTREFQQVATATLRRTGADFEKAHSDRLTALLTPFREHVGRFEDELRQVHGAADRERARLGEQIKLLSQKTEAIGTEALNLTRALKGDKQLQGAWGEMILERILEDSGLIEGTHYDRQKSHTTDDGARYRPDVIVKMPQGKCLVVDSKVSLVAYEAASSSLDEGERQRHLKDHAAALRRHIELLSSKAYEALTDGSIDYVLMFIPIEGAFSEASRVAPDLPVFASGRRIGLVTPTTLMLALKTVDHIWTVEKRERNAEDIASRAGLLHDKFVGFVEDLDKVGRALDQAVRAKADAMNKLTLGPGNLVRQTEMLRELGARTNKRISLNHDSENVRELPTRRSEPQQS